MTSKNITADLTKGGKLDGNNHDISHVDPVLGKWSRSLKNHYKQDSDHIVCDIRRFPVFISTYNGNLSSVLHKIMMKVRFHQ